MKKLLLATGIALVAVSLNVKVSAQEHSVESNKPAVCAVLPNISAMTGANDVVNTVVPDSTYASTGQRVTVKTATGQIVEGDVIQGGILSTQGSNVGPTYQAGVDAYGRPVVPANVDQAYTRDVIGQNDKVRVPLEMDLAQRLLTMPQAQGITLQAPLGMLEVYKDGRVTYNDQDWTSPINSLCGRPQRVVTTPQVVENVQAPIVAPTAPTAPVEATMQNIVEPVMVEPSAPATVSPSVPLETTAPSIQARIPGTISTKVITDKPELLQGGSN